MLELYLSCRQIEREMNVQALLDHPSILKVYGAFEDESFIYMVQQLALNGDVYKTYLSQRKQLNEHDLVAKIIAPLLRAVEHAHSRGVIHRDIKPENIFLSEGDQVLLGDWGLSIDNVQERPVSRVGTLDYMAPEVLRAPSIQPGVNFRQNGCMDQDGSYEYSVCIRIAVNIISQVDMTQTWTMASLNPSGGSSSGPQTQHVAGGCICCWCNCV